MTPQRFRTLLAELIDENPFAIRAVLKILEIEFTERVPTMAVTREQRPRLLVNLGFVKKHCATDDHVKAVICHEFLHILLCHTEDKRPLTVARHLAFDAVINAIIHRTFGPSFSSMMGKYYAKADDIRRILRSMNGKELRSSEKFWSKLPDWVRAWEALYAGKLVADDIEALAETLEKATRIQTREGISRFVLAPGGLDSLHGYLGNHDDLGRPLPGELREALDQSLREMNGSGIWRSPKSRGVATNPYEALFVAKDEPMRRWRNRTLELLKRHLEPDRSSRAREDVTQEYVMPVLSPRDRRAFIRSLWTTFIPEAVWSATIPKRAATANVYLDVSGSMYSEMPQIIALLARLSRYIRRPFWAFSDCVSPAVIKSGQLVASTTGGTSMACVLRHVAETRPATAIVITDGYIERFHPSLVKNAAGVRLHALVTRDGSPAELRRAGIPYTQLEKVPS
jgi:hypothetical protein